MTALHSPPLLHGASAPDHAPPPLRSLTSCVRGCKICWDQTPLPGGCSWPHTAPVACCSLRGWRFGADSWVRGGGDGKKGGGGIEE